MSATKQKSSPRDRIIATAKDLFYRQGFHATGINQIIKEAGVARASFYDHFPSKDDLLVAYAAEVARREITDIRNAVDQFPTAQARFVGLLDILTPWFEATGYRGCNFQILMSEVSPEAARVHEIARNHLESLRVYIRELVLDLKNSDPEFSHLDPDTLASTYQLIFEGAISVSTSLKHPGPVLHARQTICALVGLTS
jgi:AcrR family transcriptional regulator